MDESQSKKGLAYGVAAYGLWGLIPIYFKALSNVPPLQILAHRIVWSFVFLALIITMSRRWLDLGRALRSRQVLLILSASTVMIAANWFTYIYAVSTQQVLQSSLGYFMNPLVNVLLGVAFLKERLRGYQTFGIALAGLGVLNLWLAGDGVPWIAMTLAISFAFYGLLRKIAAVDGLLGLFIETTTLVPVCAGFLLYLQTGSNSPADSFSSETIVLLIASGAVTAVPLLLFGAAARRLRLSTLGVLQYLAPTMQFLLAVLVFKEPFSVPHLISFGFIWTAVVIYSADSLWAYRRHTVCRDTVTRETVSRDAVTPTAVTRNAVSRDTVSLDPVTRLVPAAESVDEL